MSKFALYDLYLKDLPASGQVFDFVLDNDFFTKINSPEVTQGNLTATVEAKKKGVCFELKIAINGSVTISCDRCLDDMQQSVSHNETLMVKFGTDFGEDGETVIVPEKDGFINLAWFFYEMVVVNIPIKHTHAAGECNKEMQQKLKKHAVRSLSDEDGDNEDNVDDFSDSELFETDPRWEKLKDIADESE